MKKLIIVGTKDLADGSFETKDLAIVYVDQNKKVVVESEFPDFREKIEKKINESLEIISYNKTEVLKIDERGHITDSNYLEIFQKPGDNNFLLAVKKTFWLWDCKKYRDYDIDSLFFKIIKE